MISDLRPGGRTVLRNLRFAVVERMSGIVARTEASRRLRTRKFQIGDLKFEISSARLLCWSAMEIPWRSILEKKRNLEFLRRELCLQRTAMRSDPDSERLS